MEHDILKHRGIYIDSMSALKSLNVLFLMIQLQHLLMTINVSKPQRKSLILQVVKNYKHLK